MTVVPVAAAQSLSLPVVATTRVAGVAGAAHASIHAALLEVVGVSKMTEVVALGSDAILGRDIINRWVLSLDGPRRALQIKTERTRARGR